MSQYTLSSAGQSDRNEASEGENSDSGDSLFITQANVPGVNEDNIWPTTDDEEREKNREKYRLPTYSFTFLSGKRQRSKELSANQNRKLHYTLMGGYFKCVAGLWESYTRGEDLLASQPTIDMDGVHIAPISEEEEEQVKETDIKVVEKKHFVVPSKAKRSKLWCSPEQTVFTVRQGTRVAGFQSQRRQRTRIDKNSRRKRFSDRNDSSGGHLSDAVLQEGETSDEDVEVQPNLLKQAKRKIFNQNKSDEELCSNISADISECDPEKSAKTVEKRPAAVLLPQNLLQRDDVDASSSKTRVKKRKKKDKSDHKCVEEGKDQSQEEVKGQHAEASASPETTEVTTETTEEPVPPESKRKKKKRRRNNSVDEDIRQTLDGHDDGRAEADSGLNAESNSKKKKRKKQSHHKDVEELNTSTLTEHLTHNGEKLNKKRKTDLLNVPQVSTEDCDETEGRLESSFVSEKMFEISHVQRKKHKKKNSAFNDNHVEENNDWTNLSGLSVKKKNVSEACVDVSSTPGDEKNADDAQKASETLEEPDADMVTKKKKKKKKKEHSSRNLEEDAETPSDYPMSAWKKEKKKTSSFLVADEEENSSQTRRKTYSQSADAEKAAVSKGCLTARAADITGSSKKKSAAEENVISGTELEEPNETGEKVLSETRIKKKKKHKRNKSDLISSTERSESTAPTDEDVVVTKKKKKKKKSKQGIPPEEASVEEKSTLSACVSHSPSKKGRKYLT